MHEVAKCAYKSAQLNQDLADSMVQVARSKYVAEKLDSILTQWLFPLKTAKKTLKIAVCAYRH